MKVVSADFLAFLDEFLNLQTAAVARFLLEIFSGDILQWQEAVAISAVVDEGRLQAGFNTCDTGFVDARLFLFSAGVFDVEVVEFLTIDQCHTNLFCLVRVYQHSFHMTNSLISSFFMRRKQSRKIEWEASGSSRMFCRSRS